MGDIEQREFAATEKRKWVRTDKACNNRCMFCLDSGMLDGTFRRPDDVKREIQQGREEGCQRLILSGGEASIHPNFMDFIAYGRELGYTWIQTISNGRRFSYGKFTKRCAELGLNEITFSIHGHTPELNDELTGIDGSFHQSLKGLLNARKLRMVANIDVVLTRKNIPHLKEILDFWMGLGIHEFDLLWLVPFGRGFDQHREELFMDPGEAFPYVQRALEGRQRPGLYLWTNRFPVEYLEGYEWLIQEPYKLHDEVNGRREMFREFACKGDEALGCLGERCDYCFMGRYCPGIRRYRTRLEAPANGFRVAALDATPGAPYSLDALSPAQRERFVEAVAAHPVERLELTAPTVAAAITATDETVAALSTAGSDPLPAIALTVDDTAGLAEAVAGDSRLAAALASVTLNAPGQLDDVRAALAAAPTLELELEANQALAEDLDGLLTELPLERVTVVVRNHDRLTKVKAAERAPDAICASLGKLVPDSVRVRNLPACLAGGQTLVQDPERDRADALFPGLLGEDGRLDARAFTDRHITHHYYAKSLRCAECIHTATCDGLHINSLRAFGFAVLDPVGDDF